MNKTEFMEKLKQNLYYINFCIKELDIREDDLILLNLKLQCENVLYNIKQYKH